MSTWTQLIHPGQLPGERTRAYHARVYLVMIRPVIIGLGLVAVLASFRAASTSTVNARDALLVVGSLAALQIPYLLGARFWARTELLLTIALIIDTCLQLALLLNSQSPVSSATGLVLPIVIVGYFAHTAVTVAFGAGLGTLIAVVGPQFAGWDDTSTIPSISFALFAVSIAIAVISARMRNTEMELEQLVIEQQTALERLQQLQLSRDRLITNVSHELRTPLTSTIGAVDTLLRLDVDIDETQRRDLLLIARGGGLRLLSLVEDLMTIGSTRPEALQLSLAPERLVPLVRDAIDGLDPGDRSIEIVTVVDPLVLVDRMRMLQVVTNLVANAIRHGRGAITIEVGRIEDYASLRVLDEGDGIPVDDVDELFLPFARFSMRTDSTGLGLPICRSIVDAHDGSLRYERTASDRTCFHLLLQLHPDTA